MKIVSGFSPPLLAQLSAQACQADDNPAWPLSSLNLLQDSDAWCWSIPTAFAGKDYSTPELLAAYEDMAAACLTTAFILSQRDAAIRRIVAFGSPAFQSEFLPRLAAGEIFTTIGLAQLTTSRQHGQPALQVLSAGAAGFLLDGEIPWVTGADQADFVVIGARDTAGLQYLFGLPRGQPGVAIEPPMRLMALAGSRTTRILLRRVELDQKWLILGPVAQVPALGRAGTGGLETSCLALGLARAAIDYLRQESTQRPQLHDLAVEFHEELTALRRKMIDLSQGNFSAEQAGALRAQANQFVLASTQAALIAAKGTGYVKGHPAERWARQALFFLVWSCPRIVQNQMLDAQLNASCDQS